MAYDLIRTLLVALLVGFAPGYFWSRCLIYTEDFTVRFTYSVALSMTLVAAAVLVPTQLLGLSVTLPIAAICVVLVLVPGIAAYYVFGPAKGSDEPLANPPRPLPLPALLLAGAAMALALGIAFEYLPLRETAPYVAVLVILAGMTQLAAPGVQTAMDQPVELSKDYSRPLALGQRLIAPLIFLLVLVRGYVGPVSNEWPSIRGVDHYSHAVMANLMMSEGAIDPYLIYPPGFHTMTAIISRLSGLDPLEIFPVLGPILLLLPALALYTMAQQLWGAKYGAAAALFSGVILGGSYLYFNDSMYPNLVTSQFLLVLAIAALFQLYFTPSVRTALTVALLGSSVLLYHQVSSLYLALLLVPVGLVFLPYLLLKHRHRGVALLFSLTLLGVLSVLYAWDTYNLPRLIGGLIGGSQASNTGAAVEMAIGSQPLYKPDGLLLNIVTQPIAWLGLLGIFLLGEGLRRRFGVPRKLAYLTLLWWTAILLVGSLTAYSGFPQRFSRDLGIPLSVLAALALLAVLRSLRMGSPVRLIPAILAALMVVGLVGFQTSRKLEEASGPSRQTTTTAEIAEGGEWLEAHNDGGNIIVSPHVNQVPSRMMLAMGDYSALQSFEAIQILNPRDLPPTGPEPLWDVLWVMQHPDGERTRRILEKYDIRYLAFYKNMPDRPTVDYWQLFTGRTDLYDKVFENEDVIIFEPEDPATSAAGE
ncbi:hypothetical protein BH24ACT20_BH24ACT20_10320 [soil metagenome]